MLNNTINALLLNMIGIISEDTYEEKKWTIVIGIAIFIRDYSFIPGNF